MKYIGAIDQGTTSSRFILFNEIGEIVDSHQLEHKQIFPQPSWVEHDPEEIWQNSSICIEKVLERQKIKVSDIAGIGITNQRETIIAWNPKTGKVWHNAIVWQDLRGTAFINRIKKNNKQLNYIQEKTGLKLSPYFAGSKIAWLLDNVPGLREEAEIGNVVFGTIDTWLVYKLTKEKVVVTDVTNASRYLLMDIETLKWDENLLRILNIPRKALPKIVSSVGKIYGNTDVNGPFKAEVPVCGILGDQQSALFGQACFTQGLAKCTYGTGCFMLVNTGKKLCKSNNGLLTTIAYRVEGQPATYALEGSIAVAGSLVQWARDNLQIVKTVKELDECAASVKDCGGVYVVPAFSGLFAPYWRSDARGIIAGLTGYANKNHICKAILEATAFQANDIINAMELDSMIHMIELKVDGGLTNSEPLMEFQSDILGIPVIRPKVVETTALGAAYAAGLTIGIFKDFNQLSLYWKEEKRWEPKMSADLRFDKIHYWKKAVDKTLNWV